MAARRDTLGPLELDVLQYVAEHHPITVGQVARHFAETSGQARTTLLTVMERLRAKGYVGRKKVGGVHHYTPKVSQVDLLHGLVGDFVEGVLGGSVSPFMAYLLKSPSLTAAEARKVEQLLKQLEAREKEEQSMSLSLVIIQQWADQWAEQIWRASWQGGIVLAAACGIARYCTFLSPRLVCWMWRLACIKLLVGLVWSAPVEIPILPAESHGAAAAHSPAVSARTEIPDAQLSPPLLDSRQGLRAPSNRALNFNLPLFGVWIAGMLCSVGIAARQWSMVHKWVCLSHRPRGGSLRSICLAQARRLGVRRLPRLRISRAVSGPAIVGLLRPTILFPRFAERTFNEGELAIMAGHELAHFNRRDLAWNWLLVTARSLFFFHPLVWVMARGWFEAQESACDALVLEGGQSRALAYGRLLLKLATQPNGRTPATFAAAGVFGTYRDLERRIITMSRAKPLSRKQLVTSTSALVLAALVSIVPWRLVAQEARPKADAGATRVLAALAAADDDQEDEQDAQQQAFNRRASMNNIKQIMLAMHNYNDKNKSLPAAFTSKNGKPLLSWRVAILPYLAEETLYKEFHLDEPWDSEHNKKLLTKVPDAYCSPASKLEGSRTVYLTPRGDTTAFPGEKGIALQQIRDGLSNTIAILEVDDARGVPWTAPDDWKYAPDHPKAGLGHLYTGGFCTGFCDGSAHFLPNGIDDAKLNALFTMAGGEIVMLP